MSQHLPLRRPFHDQPSFTHHLGEPFRQRLEPVRAADHAGADNPEEGVAGVGQTHGDFDEVGRVEGGDGAEADVEDGSVRLGVEP